MRNDLIMKTTRLILTVLVMVSSLYTLNSCKNKAPQPEPISAENLPWVVDRFDDIKVLRYEVPGFEQLPLEQKKLVYYLAEAAKCGRDILFDQNFKYNLTIRRALEQIYTKYDGERTDKEFIAMEKYLKKIWFANGIHHHYSNDKFQPEFSRAWFEQMIAKYITAEELPIEATMLCEIIFNPELYAKRLDQTDGVDMVTSTITRV